MLNLSCSNTELREQLDRARASLAMNDNEANGESFLMLISVLNSTTVIRVLYSKDLLMWILCMRLPLAQIYNMKEALQRNSKTLKIKSDSGDHYIVAATISRVALGLQGQRRRPIGCAQRCRSALQAPRPG